MNIKMPLTWKKQKLQSIFPRCVINFYTYTLLTNNQNISISTKKRIFYHKSLQPSLTVERQQKGTPFLQCLSPYWRHHTSPRRSTTSSPTLPRKRKLQKYWNTLACGNRSSYKLDVLINRDKYSGNQNIRQI